MKVVKGGTVSRLLKDVPVPEMFHARQTFSREVIAPKDIPAVVSGKWHSLSLRKRSDRE